MMTDGRAWGAVLMGRDMVEAAKLPAYLPDSNRLLIAIQFWKGDRDAALVLARFLADLEPVHTSLADMLLISRYDCLKADEDTVQYVSRKFNVFSVLSPVIRTGWPDGCNGLWGSTMRWVKRSIEERLTPAYKAVFTCEADGGPCVRNWLAQLSDKWTEANKLAPTYVAGPMVQQPARHINGNCLLSCEPKFLRWVTNASSNLPAPGGWDYVLADYFAKWGWVNIHRMRSYYNSPTFTAEQYAQMRKESLIWVHGIKDDSLIRFGKEQLLEPRQ